MEAAASKDKRISPNENNLSLSCKGVCQNCRLVRRGDGIAQFSFGTLPCCKKDLDVFQKDGDVS